MRHLPTTKVFLKSALLVSALAVFVASCMTGERSPVTITSSETPEPVAVKATDTDFSTFSHDIEEHKQFDCVSCHRRQTGETELKLAGHDSCVGCHLNQFINPARAMCTICHTDLEGTNPPVKAFPVKFREGFNMKFDHAAHDRGEGRPAQGCTFCHDPAGPGKSIPVGIGAHTNCYTCHTPDKAEIGTCTTCHELKPYNRTSPGRYVFRAVFSHNDHSAAQGVSCGECHNVREGAPQGRQVTNIAAAQHNCGTVNNCATCHNGSRAFSGNGGGFDFSSCERCHTGSGFNLLPGGPCRK
jgi:c(7)-type cytochrome triheme protein